MQNPGLTTTEAKRLLNIHGYNEVKSKKTSALEIFFNQVKSPLIYLLLLAMVISIAVDSKTDAVVIAAILIINTLIGFIQEYRAHISYQKLLSLISSNSLVLRDGVEKQIPKKDIVPGDIVFLRLGDIIPADGMVLEENSIQINESALTGEALPVLKKAGTDNSNSSDRLVFAGTFVANGTATILIQHTGKESKIGLISTLTIGTKKRSIYEENVSKLGNALLIIGVTVLFVIFITHILFKQTESLGELLLFTLAIAITIIPEALPVIVNLNLSLGAKKLGEKGIIIKRPESLEDLGNVDIICTDKTGTITQNEMTVEKVEINEKVPNAKEFFLKSSLGSNDPLDVSIIKYFKADGEELKDTFKDIPFDPVKKYSGRIFKDYEVLKGTSEYILSLCKNINYKKEIDKIAENSAALRHLSFAVKKKDGEVDYLGTFYLDDPIKDTAKEAVRRARKLGVDIRIITGDSLEVSADVAIKVGLTEVKDEVVLAANLHFDDPILLADEVKKYKVFTRCDPVQKYKIIEALQKSYLIGYLGDGINDAPSLKLADVSIVVDTSTDIAKESSDIILTQKSLEYIIDAVIDGRKIFENIEKFLKYTLIGNFGNFFTIGFLSIFTDFLPMLPIQILISNLLTDFTSLSITTDNVDLEDIKRPERLDLKNILKVSFSLGALSSIFDFVVFFVFRSLPIPLVQIIWFGYSTLEELIVLISLRTHRFFLKSKPSITLIASVVIGIFITIILMVGNFSLFPVYSITLQIILTVIGIALLCTLATEVVKLLVPFKKTQSLTL